MYATLRYCILLCFFSIANTVLFAQSDLSLSLRVSNENALIFEKVTYQLTVKNEGSSAATGVVVKAPTATLNAAFGLLYSDALTASGTYNVIFNTWNLASLPAGATATLDLILYTVKPNRPAFFAEIVAATQSDPDSEPDNGDATLGAREDDEVFRPAPSTGCNLVFSVESDTCFRAPGQTAVYGFRIQITSTDPAVQLIELANNSNFYNSSIVQANTVYAPFGNWILLNSGQSANYFYRPYGTQGCNASRQIDVPATCLEPELPSDCILPNYFPDLFCTNNTENLAIRISLLTSALIMPSVPGVTLAPNDAFRVLLNGTVIGTGEVQSVLYLGLNGQLIPMSSELVNIRIERISDGACIVEQEFIPSDYCVPANTAFCQQEGIFPWEEWIKRVQIGNLDVSSGKSSVTNNTNVNPGTLGSSATVTANDSVSFQITVGYNWIVYNDYVSMFLDTDRDGTFSQDELIYSGKVPNVPSGAGAQAVLSAKAFIPADAQNGATTLKVVLRRGEAAAVCGTVPYGEVELYNVRIGGGVNGGSCGDQKLEILGVECDDNGTPSISADDQYYINYKFDFPGYEGTSTFSGAFWVTPNGNYVSPYIPQGFINQGKVGQPSRHGPISIQEFPQLNFRVLGGFCNSEYVLIEAPVSTCSDAPFDPTLDCEASSDFPWEDWISRITVRNFVQTISLLPGDNAFTLRAAFSYLSYEEYVKVWIDFDQDGVLEETEVALQNIIPRGAYGVPFRDLSGVLRVPASALAGKTLMRVRMSRGGYANACDTQAYGEVEDYAVNIQIGLGLQSGNVSEALVPVSTENGFYPNPATDAVYVQFEPKQAAQITILNHLGKVVHTQQIDKTNAVEQLNVQSLMNGHYLLQVAVQGERTRSHGLVIAKDY
jgi:Domain of unknown function DUF11/GEVED domain/Secretion system C-terminal sorting domain